ncbi:response regulator transcription factor [Pedobacter psychrodurus]|uniref:Response regulator transcription factor n=1 Tax=Pedobacter psychrodurus TaxID=2530456 RepID=A0A4R0PK69_9SPHI|nr:response regulator transcription factor [Pedobacter psychrodurus]TCD17496.1 response regulator transcription factor [Pedobacter psychrodurus]
MQEQSISIAIVDDHTLFRSGLASLLEEFDDINITFEAVNGLDLQAKMNNHQQVQLVLMDINMPVMDGFAATKWVKTNHPNVHVLALSMLEDEKAIIGMLKAGAGGYMLKESTPSDLLTAIKVIVDKGFYVNELVSGRLLVALKDDQKPVFSARELTFLQYCSTELTYKEIADLMYVSPRTVDNYRESLFAKLNIKSRTGLVVYGIKNNLIII